jgi:hypothetical protein
VAAPPVLAEDVEPAAERRVDAVLDDRLDRSHRRVDHHLVAGGDAVHALADRLDHAGHVAAGHVGHRRLGQALGQPHVHVVERRGHGPDADVTPPHGRIVDLALPVVAGRCVEDPGSHAAGG